MILKRFLKNNIFISNYNQVEFSLKIFTFLGAEKDPLDEEVKLQVLARFSNRFHQTQQELNISSVQIIFICREKS